MRIDLRIALLDPSGKKDYSHLTFDGESESVEEAMEYVEEYYKNELSNEWEIDCLEARDSWVHKGRIVVILICIPK